ncbi:hypothetical protein PS723_06701 [Pseudomonas fluorescens]|uniref:Uncharacterized protein n=1 Tax=Pseudomonas fluorescens TaxID=294 RepID=A0A5E7F9E3_PSEFL|nr:hypothetical protein PS723_05274 [Pseudomonas fluorescens]VVO45512.1 hypothetical protein PS723_06701 [Pseudomonas fluorescens]
MVLTILHPFISRRVRDKGMGACGSSKDITCAKKQAGR